jgi:hypothetical protein
MSTSSDLFDLALTKKLLKIRDTDESEDDYLQELGETANIQFDNDLSKVANSVPLSSSTTPAITKEKKLAVSFIVCSWYKASKDPKASEVYMSQYKSTFASIVTKLQSAPNTNTRSKIVVVASSYRSEPLKSTDGDTDIW